MVDAQNMETGKRPEARLLVADDEESMRYFLKRSLDRHGYDVEAVDRGDKAIELYEGRRFDVAIVDLKMPGADGLEVLSRLRLADPEALVIIMTAYGTIRSAVDAMRQGAFDYITKPFEIDELLILVERALKQRATLRENRELRQIVDNRRAYGGLVGQSAAMRAVFQAIDMLRDSAATVLITGESGTGKELVGRAIHVHSELIRGAFVPLNCTAIPENLLESELFGHEAGAFTGANKRKRGLVEMADQGTLFLDEISEISSGAQVKLLRFLQEKKFTRLGSTEPVLVDLRIIATTNRDLEKMVTDGEFREDLFWRLNVVPIHLPPLRERREDITVLAHHFLKRFKESANAKVEGFTTEAMIALSGYAWPGNVRELENIVERLIVFNADQEMIDVDDLPETIRDVTGTRDRKILATDLVSFEEAMGSFERVYLSNLFKHTKGNISQAARLSGISRSSLHQKIRKLEIDLNKFK